MSRGRGMRDALAFRRAPHVEGQEVRFEFKNRYA
jgi:hypothetical protein